jgi:CRP/FNR family transcriptional activator FtrB
MVSRIIMRAEEFPEIASLPLFATMQPEVRDDIFGSAFLQVFPPQLTLIETGGRADFLHILVDGLVELFTVDGAREVTMQLVRPVSSFILAAAYTDQRYLMSARTLTASRILLIPSQHLREAISRDGALAAAAMTELAVRYRNIVRSLTDMKMRQTLERLANFFLLESERLNNAVQFQLPAEKRVIASLLGMTPENLSRACSALAAHGATISGPTVQIFDRVALRALARPDPVIDTMRS